MRLLGDVVHILELSALWKTASRRGQLWFVSWKFHLDIGNCNLFSTVIEIIVYGMQYFYVNCDHQHWDSVAANSQFMDTVPW